mgnify:CR=1 FL=1
MRTRWYVALILMLNTVWLPFVCAQEEQWLQYRHSREAQEILRQFGGQMLGLITSRPQEVNLPEVADKDLVFAKWPTPMVERGYVWLLLAKSSPQGIHDQLYIDSNCAGRLDDEEPIKAYRMDTRSSYFGPVKLWFDSDGRPISLHLDLR